MGDVPHLFLEKVIPWLIGGCSTIVLPESRSFHMDSSVHQIAQLIISIQYKVHSTILLIFEENEEKQLQYTFHVANMRHETYCHYSPVTISMHSRKIEMI